MKLSEDEKCELDLALRHAIERLGADSQDLENLSKGCTLGASFARLCLKIRKTREALGYIGGEIEITTGCQRPTSSVPPPPVPK